MTHELPTREMLEDFLYEEARLLDDGEFAAWLALFDEAGRYWVPLKGQRQREDERHTAIADEDPVLLRIRVERLRSGRAHSQHPSSRCQHVLQRPTLIAEDRAAGQWTLRTPFAYQECRGEDSVTLFGHYVHVLRQSGAGLRIRMKRVNLVNSDATLPMIQLFP